MKTFIRALTATLACVFLLVFSVWRYQLLPDFSAINAFIADTMNQLEQWAPVDNQTLGGGNGQDGGRPVESNGAYSGYETVENIPEEVIAAIQNIYDTHNAKADILELQLTPEQLKAAVSAVRYSCPEYFYVHDEYNYIPSASGYVKDFAPIFLYDEAQVAQMTTEYQQVIDGIVAGAPTNGNDFDKLLYLHDYFVKNYTYDYTYTIRDAYTFFKEKTGVCQAYMLALIATAEALDIRSVPVTSEVMNHAWNLVELNEEWYHVDITWDDVGSYPSYTSYAYFLQSDYGINAYDMAREGDGILDENSKVHREWSTSHAAGNNQYDNATWRESRAPMVKLGDSYYCIVSAQTGTKGTLWGGNSPLAMGEKLTIDGIWRCGNTAQYHVGCYSGLLAYGNELIYNTDSVVRAYNPTTGKSRIVAIVELERGNSIFGVCGVTDGGTVHYVVASEMYAKTYTEGTVKIS